MRRAVLPVLAALHLAAAPAPVLAQPPASAPTTPPKTYDMRDDATAWIDDPNVHAFYQATIDAFAAGPDKVDRAAFETRSHEIFRALALAHGMSPDALQNHLKAIPGEVILIVTRDPQTLASYDSFVTALFGPQTAGPATTRTGAE